MKLCQENGNLPKIVFVLAFATMLASCGSSSDSASDSVALDETPVIIDETADTGSADPLEQSIAAPELDPDDQIALDTESDLLDGLDTTSISSDAEAVLPDDNGDLLPAVFPTETSLDLAYAQAGAALIEDLNDSLALPADISVSFADCGMANAFFLPPQFNTDPEGAPGGAIIICHELTELFFNLFGDIESAFQTSVFVMMHELGHALVNQLQLPILGIEEAAVDGIGAVFSTKLGLAEGVVLAGWFFFSQGDSPFFDTHRVGTQRLGDLACWGVGGDPSLLEDPTIAGIAEQLVAAGRNCLFEYEQQLNAVNTLIGDNVRGGLVDVEVPTLNN